MGPEAASPNPATVIARPTNVLRKPHLSDEGNLLATFFVKGPEFASACLATSLALVNTPSHTRLLFVSKHGPSCKAGREKQYTYWLGRNRNACISFLACVIIGMLIMCNVATCPSFQK